MSAIRIPEAWRRWAAGGIVAFLLVPSALAQYGARLGGDRQTRLTGPDTQAVALFFVASDCPISDKTFPEMKRLREVFSARNVGVWFVYPNSTEQRAEVAKHQHEFDPGGEVLLDPDGELVRLSGAKVTPEISVLVPAQASGWRPVYTGRVDDRFVHLGLQRPQITRHFAEEALDAVLAGRPVPRATGTPVGCGIVSREARR